MTVDPRTPVLVGAGAVSQREDDPADALEVVDLMQRALEVAAADTGASGILSRLDAISAPRGFWQYGDPGRLLAERFGAEQTHTTVSEVGVLQSALLGDAARRIAAGEAEIVAVVGAEAKYRSLRAKILGVEEKITEQADVEADQVMRPHDEIYTELEMKLGLLMPVNQYAVVENALRYADGLSIAEHRTEIARMWAAMSEVARHNPAAWTRDGFEPASIREESASNRMLAFPYLKRHNSNWNVDQAAGLILCSAGAARSLGIPEERWVFPRAVIESNHMVPLSRRAEPARCQGAQIAGQRALEITGTKAAEVAQIELYSCFPVAVRLQARELGIDPHRQLTECGGMAFAGGPLNNFVLQALVRMVEVLRADRGSIGLVSAVSGILTKQGFTTWSTSAPDTPFAWEDVAERVAAATPTVEIDAELAGEATVKGYTVMVEGIEPRAVALCDAADGRRGLAASEDPEVIRVATEEELCGRRVHLDGHHFEVL